jgi:hypothetical protein
MSSSDHILIFLCAIAIGMLLALLIFIAINNIAGRPK